ncbi:MAG: tRNA pseudouridine(55) synthase TruB [Fusobacteriaceae bacterium]
MDGIICVNKESGMTSFDVVRKLKKILSEKKIGHTGTLDPLATGVLVVCIGRATKLVQDIESERKIYVAEFQLGYKTDTYDIEGAVLERTTPFCIPCQEKVAKTLQKFVGKQKQIPPMYSALKFEGKRLYELAREGISIERVPREIEINYIELIEFDAIKGKGKLICEVSKGTYIRSLIFDIGEELKTFATLTSLERTKVGKTKIENCLKLSEIDDFINQGNVKNFLISAEKYFEYPCIEISGDENFKYYKNGNSFRWKAVDGKYSVYYDKKFIGFASSKDGRLQAYKYF